MKIIKDPISILRPSLRSGFSHSRNWCGLAITPNLEHFYRVWRMLIFEGNRKVPLKSESAIRVRAADEAVLNIVHIEKNLAKW